MRPFLPLLIAGALMAGCETTVEVPFPDYEPELVVDGLFVADSNWVVGLTHSVGIMEPGYLGSRPTLVRGATLVILEDGVVLDTLVLEEPVQNAGHYRSPVQVPRAGRTYTLRASAPGYAPVEATAHVPDPASFTAEVAKVSRDPYGNESFDLSVRIADPAGTRNYYRLSVVAEVMVPAPQGPFLNVNHLSFRSADPVLLDESYEDVLGSGESPYYGTAYFTDRAFDGEVREIRLEEIHNFYRHQPGFDVRFYVRLATISEAYYRYARSVEEEGDGLDDVFAEPSQVYTNVSGGLGIFAGGSVAAVPFTLSSP